MKKFILVLSFFTTTALAQMFPGFSAPNMANMEKNMQSMMASMANIEQCMNQVDQSKIDDLGTKAEKLEQEIAKLCQQGNRSAAQNKVLTFSKEMNNHTELKKMKKCMAPMGTMMQSMPFEHMFDGIGSGNKHVCEK